MDIKPWKRRIPLNTQRVVDIQLVINIHSRFWFYWNQSQIMQHVVTYIDMLTTIKINRIIDIIHSE